MAEISFYQLTTSPLYKALPSLVEKAYESGARVLVVTDNSMLKQVDDGLWTANQQKFIPHGTKNPDQQPVFIDDKIANDNRQVLVITNGAKYDKKYKFAKVLDIFDGNVEEDLKNARARYKHYKAEGIELKYWSQDDKGKWISNN